MEFELPQLQEGNGSTALDISATTMSTRNQAPLHRTLVDVGVYEPNELLAAALGLVVRSRPDEDVFGPASPSSPVQGHPSSNQGSRSRAVAEGLPHSPVEARYSWQRSPSAFVPEDSPLQTATTCASPKHVEREPGGRASGPFSSTSSGTAWQRGAGAAAKAGFGGESPVSQQPPGPRASISSLANLPQKKAPFAADLSNSGWPPRQDPPGFSVATVLPLPFLSGSGSCDAERLAPHDDTKASERNSRAAEGEAAAAGAGPQVPGGSGALQFSASEAGCADIRQAQLQPLTAELSGFPPSSSACDQRAFMIREPIAAQRALPGAALLKNGSPVLMLPQQEAYIASDVLGNATLHAGSISWGDHVAMQDTLATSQASSAHSLLQRQTSMPPLPSSGSTMCTNSGSSFPFGATPCHISNRSQPQSPPLRQQGSMMSMVRASPPSLSSSVEAVPLAGHHQWEGQLQETIGDPLPWPAGSKSYATAGFGLHRTEPQVGSSREAEFGGCSGGLCLEGSVPVSRARIDTMPRHVPPTLSWEKRLQGGLSFST
mmetsp:Transcript_22846/g.53427  ORF Transcript_22846/g.53427 Transcript_22846/m.53427 type:complete len:546 (+) Transcript_22846:77-1714(+)|eukprot:CAMPEP_0178441660 /NCGR_PEP_ID=MMETSP0689_2-20121128/37617_1 /TAXON_ID=160604 /ORGANISM="Amphidinium massartii, Strain CS-259" /LENGTH=545 /DNA_ID=CAMNT_0020064889 /DNA_START=40 /DNA_END=1677 /DNA_ORIENTATION=-